MVFHVCTHEQCSVSSHFTVQLFYLLEESYALHYAGEKMSSLYYYLCSINIVVMSTIALDNNSITIHLLLSMSVCSGLGPEGRME